MARTPTGPKQVDALQHGDSRLNIPTAEMQSFFQREEDHAPREPTHYARARPLADGETRDRNPDHDPQIIWNGVKITLSQAQLKHLTETGSIEIGDAQLVWRGKDTQDWTDLIVQTPPLYIQEKIHPKAIIEELKRQTAASAASTTDAPDLFADFNGVPPDASAEFYQHSQHWSNRMILGDSLQVMASLAEREQLKGQVQCIYFDPPYGIKFNSNWQVSTQSRDVKDGKQTDITREPEQVKAFRDTWKDGIHSYLTYLRDRLIAMRDLLTDSGSVFVQIGDENVHRVRSVLDEVFGPENFIAQIQLKKSGGATSEYLPGITDFVCWFAKRRSHMKFRKVYQDGSRRDDDYGLVEYEVDKWVTSAQAGERGLSGRALQLITLTSQRQGRDTSDVSAMGYPFAFRGHDYRPSKGRGWTTTQGGMQRLDKAGRIAISGAGVRLKKYLDDAAGQVVTDFWDDLIAGAGRDKTYVVQTGTSVIQRCILMATDPGDLVLDPTCGSGTTAYVAEQWGRRWITIDTSRVALALARTRLMAARYPWYLLADSTAGAAKEGMLTQRPPAVREFTHDLRQGFVYERVPHITLKSIANNPRIDTIWDAWQALLEPLRCDLNAAIGKAWEEWEIPRALPFGSDDARKVHAEWWEARIARQREMDEAIAARADVELLYDRPYSDNSRIRVAGPFTVESLSPHRIVASDEGELIDHIDAAEGRRERTSAPKVDFAQIVIEHLKSAGIHQSDKINRIEFDSVAPWPGRWIGAEGRFMEGEGDSAVLRRAGILIGPEYGTLARPDLTAAAREANDAGFDLMIACAFNYDAHSSELDRLGPLPILKARMNPDLHMADELKNTGKGNLFVIFGEPDISIDEADAGQLIVRVHGVDVYDPNTGDVRSNDVRDIAAWFIDTDYNEESFFVRHAYFLGANDPYKQLKTALKAEIDENAWATLYRAVSRPFDRPRTGAIAVKVINHFGDEVMKVYRV